MQRPGLTKDRLQEAPSNGKEDDGRTSYVTKANDRPETLQYPHAQSNSYIRTEAGGLGRSLISPLSARPDNQQVVPGMRQDLHRSPPSTKRQRHDPADHDIAFTLHHNSSSNATIIPVADGDIHDLDVRDDEDGDGDDDDDDDGIDRSSAPIMQESGVKLESSSSNSASALCANDNDALCSLLLKSVNASGWSFHAACYVKTTVKQVIDALRKNHFFRPSISTASSFRNQGYYTQWITVGVTAWISVLGPSRQYAEFSNFTDLFSVLQGSGSSETSWGLDIHVLKMLFWLSGAGFTVHDRTESYSSRLVLAEFCLLLLWLGPANLANIVPASDAIQMIYNWLIASKERVHLFQGLCSRQSAISTLRFSTFHCVYHLNEGRMECGREFPADYRIEFFCRNLVCTSAVSSTGAPLAADKSGAAFRHDLMIDITRLNELQSSIPVSITEK